MIGQYTFIFTNMVECIKAYHWLFVLYDVIFYRYYKLLLIDRLGDRQTDGRMDGHNKRKNAFSALCNLGQILCTILAKYYYDQNCGVHLGWAGGVTQTF